MERMPAPTRRPPHRTQARRAPGSPGSSRSWRPPLFLALALAAAAVPAGAQTPSGERGGEAAPPPAGGELLAEARALAEAGETTGAIARLQMALRRPQAGDEERRLLAGLYLEAGRAGEAWALLAPLAADAAADAQTRFAAARAALAAGQPEAAESLLAELVARDPLSRAAVLLGQLRQEGGRHAAALELLSPLARGPEAERLAELEPRAAAEVLLLRARSLRAGALHAEAAGELVRATELDPELEAAWRLLGETLVELDRVEEARAALARAQSLAERQHAAEAAAAAQRTAAHERAQALLRQAFTLHQEGNAAEALETLRQAKTLIPRNPLPRMLAVRLLTGLGREREAELEAEELVAQAPDNPDALHLRGMVRLAANDPTGAEPDLRRALELQADHLGAMNGLALLLMSTGREAEAEALLERLLDAWPGDEMATRNRERLRQRQTPPP
jgi:tetratricopeptide (TPR) repeat protein